MNIKQNRQRILDATTFSILKVQDLVDANFSNVLVFGIKIVLPVQKLCRHNCTL